MASSSRAALAALAVCALGLAACSDDGGTSPTSDPGATSSPGAHTSSEAPDEAVASTDPATVAAGATPDEGATTDGSSTTAASPGPVTGEPVEVHLTAMGDILAHSRVNNTANAYAGGAPGTYDYAPMFAHVADLLGQGQLTLCHMETPISPDNTNLSQPDIMVFNTPHQIVDALAGAGVDGCEFASNHTMDRDLQGLADTQSVIEGAGLGYAGPTMDEDQAGVATTYDVDGVTLAHLAYTYTYPNSGTPTTTIPGGAPWLELASWPSIGSEGILEQARAARRAGADFVVVSMHWGNEYQAAPTEQQRQIAQDLLTSDDVDLILGTHVHVIQPCEKIDGKHVLYGMGNFLSNQSPDIAAGLLPGTQEGMIAQLTLKRDEAGEITTAMAYQPTRVDITGGLVDGPHVVRPATRETYPETWERTTTTVDSLGGCEATPAG